MINSDLGIIIPAYNEELHLKTTLKALKKLSPSWNILVVNDGSKDKTGEIAWNEGAELINLGKNYGKGYALKTGIETLDNSILVFLDADIGESAKEVVKLINPIQEGRADVTIGKIEFTPGQGGFGIVKKISQRAFKYLTGTECSSVLSGQRAFKKESIDPGFLNYKRFGIEFGMTVDMVKSGLLIMEVPIEIHHRVTGRDLLGFKHRFKQFWDILLVVLYKKIRSYKSRETK